MHRDDRRGMRWRSDVAATLPVLEREEALLCGTSSRSNEAWAWTQLPRGVVHADLFPNNVLFRDRRITGVIDFYYACNDCRVYDLAITVNQWCNDDDVAIDENRACALIRAYHQLRPLQSDERAAWPACCATARWILDFASQGQAVSEAGVADDDQGPGHHPGILLERRDNSGVRWRYGTVRWPSRPQCASAPAPSCDA